jgi:hypothetical protein
VRWINSEPPRISELVAAGPALVHFFDFAQLNSLRALPYHVEWHRRYAAAGLAVLAIHSPRFAFTAYHDALAAAVARLGIGHPVAEDSDHAIWHDYGAEGWPSLFLWARGGALSWFHFGEGEYRATEEAIQDELRSAGFEGALPEPTPPLRPSDAPGALVAAPSAEVFPGGGLATPWSPGDADEAIEVSYAAGGAHASLDGRGRLRVSIDDGPPRAIAVEHPGLFDLAAHPRHEEHRVLLEASPGVRVWTISFSPGLP